MDLICVFFSGVSLVLCVDIYYYYIQCLPISLKVHGQVFLLCICDTHPFDSYTIVKRDAN